MPGEHDEKLEEEIRRADDKRMEGMQEEIKSIAKDVDDMQEGDLKPLGIDMASVKADLDWLKRYHWLVVASSIGALISSLVNLLHNKI